MKKGLYVGLVIFLIGAFVLNLKKKETPKIAEAQKPQTVSVRTYNRELYKKLPNGISFCSDQIIFTEDQKITLAVVLEKEIKRFNDESLRNLRNNMWFSYIRKRIDYKRLWRDLSYIPICESNLEPLARSEKGARGPWQLMPGTATDYKLKIEADAYDERCNFVTSTDAALSYLADLHKSFGNWIAVLAAYNTGEKNLSDAIIKENTKDFFLLKTIKEETQEFPYRVIATKLIFESPDNYGFSKNGWFNEGHYNNWEVIKVNLDIEDDWMLPDELIQLLGQKYTDWDFSLFEKYNPHIFDSFQRGKYVVCLVKERGAS